jgi:hypothetical protein
VPIPEPALSPSLVFHYFYHQLVFHIARGYGRVEQEEGIAPVSSCKIEETRKKGKMRNDK